MKSTLLLFLAVFSLHAQNHHFKIENKELFWQMTFKTSETDIMTLIDKKHDKINVDKKNNTGKGIHLINNCRKGLLDDLGTPLNFDFTVQIIDTTYTVLMTNLIYDVDMEDEGPTKYYSLKKIIVTNDATSFRKPKNIQEFIECLDLYFIDLFKIANSETLTTN